VILQSFWIRKDDGGRERERERDVQTRETGGTGEERASSSSWKKALRPRSEGL